MYCQCKQQHSFLLKKICRFVVTEKVKQKTVLWICYLMRSKPSNIVRKKVFNWQRFICTEVTSYKIHTFFKGVWAGTRLCTYKTTQPQEFWRPPWFYWRFRRPTKDTKAKSKARFVYENSDHQSKPSCLPFWL